MSIKIEHSVATASLLLERERNSESHERLREAKNFLERALMSKEEHDKVVAEIAFPHLKEYLLEKLSKVQLRRPLCSSETYDSFNYVIDRLIDSDNRSQLVKSFMEMPYQCEFGDHIKRLSAPKALSSLYNEMAKNVSKLLFSAPPLEEPTVVEQPEEKPFKKFESNPVTPSKGSSKLTDLLNKKMMNKAKSLLKENSPKLTALNREKPTKQVEESAKIFTGQKKPRNFEDDGIFKRLEDKFNNDKNQQGEELTKAGLKCLKMRGLSSESFKKEEYQEKNLGEPLKTTEICFEEYYLGKKICPARIEVKEIGEEVNKIMKLYRKKACNVENKDTLDDCSNNYLLSRTDNSPTSRLFWCTHSSLPSSDLSCLDTKKKCYDVDISLKMGRQICAIEAYGYDGNCSQCLRIRKVALTAVKLFDEDGKHSNLSEYYKDCEEYLNEQIDIGIMKHLSGCSQPIGKSRPWLSVSKMNSVERKFPWDFKELSDSRSLFGKLLPLREYSF